MNLRPYQQALVSDVRAAWAQGARNVVMVLDTGGGKTRCLASIIAEHVGGWAAIAHRFELVRQLSLALAAFGIRHNIIAAKADVRAIIAEHCQEFGRSFYDPGARGAVVSIDTLTRAKGLEAWAAQVTLWVTDEGHHVIVDNKWGDGLKRFTNPYCRGLLPTATPERADGKGLGRHADGVADAMVHGPPMRWLIEEGYLTDYRMVCAESDVVRIMQAMKTAPSGDFSPAALHKAAQQSHIVGDIVREYLRWNKGCRDLTFTPDVETARDVLGAYRAAGVRAELVTGDTLGAVRRNIFRQFERGEIQELVVVDIVSEGTDLPAVQSGALGRYTESLPLYRQQFGRFLRPYWAPGTGDGPEFRFNRETREGRLASIAASDKPVAWVRDHVNNFLRHGPPDRPRVWTLDRRGKRATGPSDAIPLRVCLGCAQPYERFRLECPYCGEPAPAPASRASPDVVEGDLAELDAETLARLRGAVVEAQRTVDEYRVHARQTMPTVAVMANVKRHADRLDALASLREAMTAWCAARLAEGLRDREVHKGFWLAFGTDVMSAQALGRAEAASLDARVRAAL